MRVGVTSVVRAGDHDGGLTAGLLPNRGAFGLADRPQTHQVVESQCNLSRRIQAESSIRVKEGEAYVAVSDPSLPRLRAGEALRLRH